MIVRVEVKLARKLKASFTSHPERPSEPYYALLNNPYLTEKYTQEKWLLPN